MPVKAAVELKECFSKASQIISGVSVADLMGFMQNLMHVA
jgi:hypothetical protein